MAGLAGVFFLSVLAFAGWAILSTLRQQLDRIALLARYAPAIGAELPPAPRVTVLRAPARLPLRQAA